MSTSRSPRARVPGSRAPNKPPATKRTPGRGTAECKALLSAILRSSSLGINVFRVSDGRSILVNDTFLDLVGYARDEVEGHSAAELGLFVDPGQRARWMRQLRAGSPVAAQDARVRRKSGEIRDTVASLEGLDMGGEQVVLVVATDVTESRKAERELRQSQQMFSSAFHLGPAAMTVTRIADGAFVDVNDSFLELFGFSRGEVIGHTAVDLRMLTPEGRRALIDAQVAAGGLRAGELEARTKSGDVRTLLFSSKPLEVNGEACLVTTMIDLSARIEAEKALRESEARFRAVFESANVGKSMTLPGGELAVNEAFCAMMGYTREELRGRRWQDITPAQDVPAVQAILEPLLAGRASSARFTKRYLRKDGSILWADVSTVVRRDPQGRPLHFITTVTDISDRVHAERELAASEERYRALFENMTAGFVLFKVIQDDEGRPVDLVIVAANGAFAATTGLKLPDVLGARLTRALPGIERDAADWVGTYGRIALTGEPLQLEQHSELLDRYYAIAAYRSGPGLCAVSFFDITAEKKAEAALRRSEERFRNLFAQAGDGIFLLSTDGRFLDANPRGLAILGYDRDELPRLSLTGVLEAGERPRMQGEPPFLSPGPGGLAEWRFLRGDGSTFPAEVSARMLDDGSTLAIVRDLTARKQAEALVQQLNESLEQRVRERTAQLEAANREMEAFSYSVSHDLRAPLRAVDGFTRILLEGYQSRLDDEGRRICSVISESAREMGRLIDDLLSFSRVGRTAMAKSRIDMEAMARATFAEVAAGAQGPGAELRLAALPPAIGDPALVRQLWRNLLSNAVKFSSRREHPLVEVSAGRDGDETVYRVRDNGAGFEMAYADRLFGVFQRLHSSTEFEGTGVGLAIVQRIVHRHGGRVWARGEPDRGAEFSFTLGP